MSPPTVIGQTCLDIKQKKELCKAKMQHANLSQKDLIEMAMKKWVLSIPFSHTDNVESEQSYPQLQRQRKKNRAGGAKYPRLDAAVDLWCTAYCG